MHADVDTPVVGLTLAGRPMFTFLRPDVYVFGPDVDTDVNIRRSEPAAIGGSRRGRDGGWPRSSFGHEGAGHSFGLHIRDIRITNYAGVL